MKTKKLVVSQNATGYRFSMEPFLLADFIRPGANERILEVGTGCAIISLLLLTRQPNLTITALELQQALYSQAQSNLANNDADHQVTLLHVDFMQWQKTESAGFDWVISNPPYRKQGHGRINPNLEKALARHEIALTLTDLVERGARLLSPSGNMALAYPVERHQELITELERNELNLKQLKWVAGRQDTEPRFFLALAGKNKEQDSFQEEVFFIYEEDGAYTPEMRSIYESFNYSGRSHRHR